MSTLRLQALSLLIFAILLVAMQCLLFLSTANSFYDAIFSHRWTWIFYFFVSLASTERLGRWLQK